MENDVLKNMKTRFSCRKFKPDPVEKEKLEAEHEENRIADLKERCQKKGLDFESENAKYLAKQAEKKAKAEAKAARKAK